MLKRRAEKEEEDKKRKKGAETDGWSWVLLELAFPFNCFKLSPPPSFFPRRRDGSHSFRPRQIYEGHFGFCWIYDHLAFASAGQRYVQDERHQVGSFDFLASTSFLLLSDCLLFPSSPSPTGAHQYSIISLW